MKHNQNNRRPRSRGGKQRHQGGRNNFESNGPEVKVRGTAQQVLDKYLLLARDAQTSGDRINAESYLQHAEHYYRVLNADQANTQNANQNAQKDETPSRRERAANAGQAEAEARKEQGAITDNTVSPRTPPTEVVETAEVISTNSAPVASDAPTGDTPVDATVQQPIPGLPPAIPDPSGAETADPEAAAAGAEEPKPRRRRSRKPKVDETEIAQA